MGMTRRAVATPISLALVAALNACSGGGSSLQPGTCRRAEVATSGPGDTLDYFPNQVGRSWTYVDESTGMTGVTVVSGTQLVGNETASVFRTAASGSSNVELVVKRGAGVYVVSDGSAEPPLDQLYPSLILPFPVAVAPAVEVVRCSALAVGDLDQDGKEDHVDIVGSLRVFSVSETADLQVGQFTNVAHTQVSARVTVAGTRAGTVTVDATRDDWYARGVGRILSLVKLSSSAYSESSTTRLTSWTTPTALSAPQVPPDATASVALAEPMASPLEVTAVRLARRAVGLKP